MRNVIVTAGAPIAQVSETLTARQRDVLAMIGQGLTNKHIARTCEISPETVKSHVKRIFLKLGVSTRAEAVSRAGLFVATATVSRPDFLRAATILWSTIAAIGCIGPVSADPVSGSARSPAPVSLPSLERTLLAQASGDSMARCQQLYGLYDRYNSDTLTRPLDVRSALEDCRKGNITSGVAALKRSLERAHIPVPPTESGIAQTPDPLRPHREGLRSSQ
jgi:DNA-binding CsgD family transcriptional regulator